MRRRRGGYILVVHYRLDTKPDEFFYLTQEQVMAHHLWDSEWKDLGLNRPEREQFKHQALAQLATYMGEGRL